MMDAAFEAKWIPRVGRKGAEQLWRARHIGRLWCALMGLGFGASELIARHTLAGYVGAGLCCALATCLYCWFLFIPRVRLATAIGELYGIERPRKIPRMAPATFDRWAHKHGLTPIHATDPTPAQPEPT